MRDRINPGHHPNISDRWEALTPTLLDYEPENVQITEVEM